MAEAVSITGAFTRAQDKSVTFGTGLLAPLAGGAVTARMGDTVVLVTATGGKSPREGVDFFPLTVDVEERMYAAGKIPGSFFRREARAGEQAILTCRLIDRPLRPSFPHGFRNDVHVVVTVLGADQTHPYDIIALNGASLALCLSEIPFNGPVGAVKLVWSADGDWIPFPTYAESQGSAFEMVVAGRLVEDDVAVMMVEAAGTTSTWQLYQSGTPKVNEEVLAAGLEVSKTWIREMIGAQQRLIDSADPKEKIEPPLAVDYSDEVIAAVRAEAFEQIAASQSVTDKAERQAAESAASASAVAALSEQFSELPDTVRQIRNAVRAVTKEVVRERIVTDGTRIDGRGTHQLRPLLSQVGVIPTAHGSGLFQRGETQVLNFTTLGLGRTDMMIDDLSPTDKKRYFHHYNFPPFCTGETGFMRGPKRREIGHGALAERAVFPVVPGYEDWPYTVRTVSEVMSSNGSSSMASVCGSTLSLMDAGVPIKAPVAGVAMGLVHAGDAWVTLTDILGAEDAFGDMDFKVAGTTDFITALQLDTKILGVPASVLSAALRQARDARLDILDVMAETIMEPRSEVRDTAPKIISFEIPVEKIGDVIGPKGKVINAIQSETGADISVDDDGVVGVVAIASIDRDAVSEAERQIKLILDPPSADIGTTYSGRVVNITKFGAFVNILPGRDGLVHISKLGGGRRINRVEDVLSLGEELDVIVEDVDPKGKISLLPKFAENDKRQRGAPQRSDDRGPRARIDNRRNSRNRRPKPRSPQSRGPRSRDGGGRDGRSRDAGRGRPERTADGRRMSFEDAFDSELQKDFGDLGPAPRQRHPRGGRPRNRR